MSSKPYQRNLPVPFFSQRDNTYVWKGTAPEQVTIGGITYNPGDSFPPVPMAGISCNITSLCMILHYFGVTDDTPDEMMRRAFEEKNWLKEPNVGYGDTYTGASRPQHINSIKEIATDVYKIPSDYVEISLHSDSTRKTIGDLHDYIKRGYPVYFSYGPLGEAEEGKGHIAVIRGFTEHDDVLINDPWGDAASPYGYLRNQAMNKGYFY